MDISIILFTKIVNSLGDQGGKEQCRFLKCRRCTGGVLSSGLSLSPKDVNVEDNALK